MNNAATITPPEPLTEHEKSLKLIKAEPPEPTWAYYVLAAGTAVGGWVMGLVYLKKDGAANKAFGVRAIVLGFLLPAVIVGSVLLIRATQVPSFTPAREPGVLLPE